MSRRAAGLTRQEPSLFEEFSAAGLTPAPLELRAPVPAPRPQAVEDTSKIAWEKFCATHKRAKRWIEVTNAALDLLAAQRFKELSTTSEIKEWMNTHGFPRYGDNQVRPALTQMVQAGLFAKGPKRHCKVTGEWVLTWRPLVTR